MAVRPPAHLSPPLTAPYRTAPHNHPGSGSDEIRALTRRWASLPADIYPGAGPGSLTPDGRLDPLLAFAYDAVSALAMGIREEQMTADTWGSTLPGFVTERYVTAKESFYGSTPNFSRLTPGRIS